MSAFPHLRRTLRHLIKRTAIIGALSALAACSAVPDRYPMKSDAKPHPGVAKAKTLPHHGIDVSKWQRQIDWDAVKAAGTRFVFIKATEGGDHADERFIHNWYGAEKAGIPRGAYHFVFWCRSAEDQAAWFRQTVPNDPNALPPVLDVEWNGHSRTCPKKVPKEEALALMRHMLAEMEAHTGKRPIIYTDITFHEEILEGQFNDYPYWIRSVAAEPHERYVNRPWTFWQYTTTGRVPGVIGDVDRNAFYGSDRDWSIFLATHCDPRLRERLERRGVCNEK